MPKFALNQKQVEGRARKAEIQARKKLVLDAKKEAEKDRQWQIGAKDESKKKEKEAKRLEKLALKKERKQDLEAEQEELGKSSSGPRATGQRSSSALIMTMSSGASSQWKLSRSSSAEWSDDELFYEWSDDALSTGSSECSATVDLSCSSMSVPSGSSMERHPERRMKASFLEYKEKVLPVIKKEYPMLRHSQHLQMLHKKWKKAPENPFNQPHISYETSQEAEQKALQELSESSLSNLRI